MHAKPDTSDMVGQAIQHHIAGRLDEAEALYRNVLEGRPGHPEASHNLGVLLAARGDPGAPALLKAALEGEPAQERYWISYIDTLERVGRIAEAAEVLALGQARGLHGARSDILAARLDARLLDPKTLVETLDSLCGQRRLQEVVEYARVFTERFPEEAYGWKILGAAMRDLGHPRQAAPLQHKAVELAPEDATAHLNLANTYDELGMAREAVPLFQKAVKLGADLPAAHFSLSVGLKFLYRLIEAEASCRRALALQPDFGVAHQHLAATLSHLCDYREVASESDLALELTAHSPAAASVWNARLYTFSYHPDLTAEAIYGEFVRWGDRFPDPVVDFSGHDRTPGRRLKVGYVSPDFRKHTSRFYFMPLMANHDHGAFETFAYSNVLVEDEHTENFKGVLDQWRDIRGLSAQEAADLIRRDGIDILVDCCSHMQDDRLDIFTLKPAPIQATWLGAAWTTGLKTIDYVLFDPYIAPEGTLAREKIVRLPHCFIAYRPPETTAEVAALPAERNGHVTFGYSGRTERLNHKTFRVWGEILRQIPNARLILDYHPFADPPTQDHYRRFMAEHGVHSERVEMRRSPNIFEGLSDIDILLDCFPHSGGTMLFDAMWMGVPALTLKSRPPLGRIGASLMTNLGMTDWVAESETDYIDKAVAFAADIPALAAVRAELRDRMRASPLMDETGFAKDVEDAYRTMWLGFTQPTGPDASI